MAQTTLFSGVTLTASFGDNQSAAINMAHGPISLYVNYLNGDETSGDMQLEFALGNSPASGDWYRGTNNEGTLQTITLAAGKTRIPLSIDGVADGLLLGHLAESEVKMRVRVKATGGTPTGTITVTAIHNG